MHSTIFGCYHAHIDREWWTLKRVAHVNCCREHNWPKVSDAAPLDLSLCLCWGHASQELLPAQGVDGDGGDSDWPVLVRPRTFYQAQGIPLGLVKTFSEWHSYLEHFYPMLLVFLSPSRDSISILRISSSFPASYSSKSLAYLILSWPLLLSNPEITQICSD